MTDQATLAELLKANVAAPWPTSCVDPQCTEDHIDPCLNECGQIAARLLAAGVRVGDAGLREAAQAMVTWWDTPPYTYDDRDIIERIEALRAALATEEKR